MDNTVAPRVETDNIASTVATVDFTYDARQRLIDETRTVGSTTVYDITYTYDQLGNRKTNVDSVLGETVEYDYDVDHTSTELSAYITKRGKRGETGTF